MHGARFYNRRYDILICLFLILSAIVVYGQGRNHEFINVYDDKPYVTENNHVKDGLTLEGLTWAFTTAYASNWHPLTWLSHMTDCQLFGMNPGWHHITNLLFHTLNTLLLFIILKRMTGHLWRSAFVAALFSLHPIHVESVAFVAERKDVLSTFFWMLTIWGYIWYLDRPGLNRYLPLLLFFILGLLAKPMLVTLPFVLLLLDYWPLNRFGFGPSGASGKQQRKSPGLLLIWEKAPLFALAAASSVVTLFAQKSGGAVGSLEEYPIGGRIGNALISYIYYLGKMIWPHSLAVFYPYSEMLPSWQVAGACLLLLCISLVVIMTMKQLPYLAVGWLWYIGTLVPVIGLVQVGDQAMADRYTYIPLIGIFVAVAWGVSELLGPWRHREKVLSAAGTAIISVLLVVTWVQVGYWRDSITLFQHALDVTSNNHMAHNNLGSAFDNQGRKKEAFVHWFEAVRIKPEFPEAHYNLGTVLQDQGKIKEAIGHYHESLRIRPEFPQAHYNLATALAGEGNLDEAISHYLEALRIDPGHAEAQNNLGVALERKGRIKEAITHYTEALRIKPDHAVAHNNLANALMAQGSVTEAIEHYQEALRGRAEFPEAHNNLGMALERQGELKKAVSHYYEALRINPDYAEAHINLGNALSNQGKLRDATGHFSEAVRIDPDRAPAHFKLGNILFQKGDFKEAIRHYSEALRVNPDYSQAHYNLGNTLYRQGDFKGAIRHYSEAIRIEPDYAKAHYNLGITLESQGNVKEAIRHFSEALRVNPNFTQARRKLELSSGLK
jgi:tetratricopeptide (TPR) repeat protein